MDILPVKRESIGDATAADDDIIPSLLNGKPFKIRPDDEKLSIVQKGRPLPKLFIVKRDNARNCDRTFQESWYEIHKWLCGSKQYNKLFCWPCLLMRPESSSWCSTGNDDMKRISAVTSKHSTCKSHIKSTSEYDATLVGYGMLPEFVNEGRSDTKDGDDIITDKSDSEDYFNVYFTDDQKSNKSKEEVPEESPSLQVKSNTNGSTVQSNNNNEVKEKCSSSKPHISFKAWQEITKQSHPFYTCSENKKWFKWRRKIAKQELKNARLTEQKILMEIELLRAKVKHVKSLSVMQKTPDETSITVPLIVPVASIDPTNIDSSMSQS